MSRATKLIIKLFRKLPIEEREDIISEELKHIEEEKTELYYLIGNE